MIPQLFPSWQGNFEGTRPSLTGLSNEHVITTLQQGLISDVELKSLLHLIRSPDVGTSLELIHILLTNHQQSHFLKVPSLPFHSLISILSKFPTDEDSRVFWSLSLRDILYGEAHFRALYHCLTSLLLQMSPSVTSPPIPIYTDANILPQLQFRFFSRGLKIIHFRNGPAYSRSWSGRPWIVMVRACCSLMQDIRTNPPPAFTAEQMSKLSDILEAALPQSKSNSNSNSAGTRTATHTPDSVRSGAEPFQPSRKANSHVSRNTSPYGNLAKEFGVEPHLVEALAQRLSKLT